MVNPSHHECTELATASPSPSRTPSMPPIPFPFTAIEGQEELKLALILAAINPRIGGVLIEGPRGTAKTTAARALAQLLTPAPFVTVPLSCSLEHLTGSLNLDKILKDREVVFAPGLLSKCHNGVLYVDEINLLPDALVDVLLDAAASGINHVERDGISHTHASRFVLIGTMNPQEGTLRPQLLDRMGLSVSISNVNDPHIRQRIVRARLAYDNNPDAFIESNVNQQTKLMRQLQHAHRLIEAAPPLHSIAEDVLLSASQACIAYRVDGMRADIALLRAAQAFAAWEAVVNASVQDCEVASTAIEAPWQVQIHHIERVTELVLRHRTGSCDENPSATSNKYPPSPDEHSQAVSDSSGKPSSHHLQDREQYNLESQRVPSSALPSPEQPSNSVPETQTSKGDWGEQPAEPILVERQDNPLLQRWLQQLSQVVADTPKKT